MSVSAPLGFSLAMSNLWLIADMFADNRYGAVMALLWASLAAITALADTTARRRKDATP